MPIPKILRFTIETISDAQSPLSYADWQLYTFYPNDLGLPSKDRDEVASIIEPLVDLGLAYHVSYKSSWPQYEFTVAACLADAVIVDEGDNKDVPPASFVAEMLAEFSAWAQGECYYWKEQRITSVAPEYDFNKSMNNGAYWSTIHDRDGVSGRLNLRDSIVKEVQTRVHLLGWSPEETRLEWRGDARGILTPASTAQQLFALAGVKPIPPTPNY